MMTKLLGYNFPFPKIQTCIHSADTYLLYSIIIAEIEYDLLGVPGTSWILTGDSQRLSFSAVTKVPFLIF